MESHLKELIRGFFFGLGFILAWKIIDLLLHFAGSLSGHPTGT